MTAPAIRSARPDEGRWQPPTFSMPMAYPSIPKDWPKLGERNDRAWHRAPFGELEVTDRTFDVSGPIPNGPLLRERDGDHELVRLLRVHAPGTFERLAAAVAASPPERRRADFLLVDGDAILPLPAGRPIDALADLAVIRGGSNGYAGRELVRGADRILEYIATRPDPARHLVRARRLLAPFLRDGKPPACELGCGQPAVTCADAAPEPLAWCGECGPKVAQ